MASTASTSGCICRTSTTGRSLGFWFLNYHSRLPLISGRTGTRAGVGNAFGALTAVGAAAQALAAGVPLNQAIALATGAGFAAANSPAAGGNLTQAAAAQYATIGANTALRGGDVTQQATNIAVHEYAKTAGYFTEFPEDIQMFGVSFNTQLQKSGIALQGEISYRNDVPLQYDDVEAPVRGADAFRGRTRGAARHAAALRAALCGRSWSDAQRLQSARALRSRQ